MVSLPTTKSPVVSATVLKGQLSAGHSPFDTRPPGQELLLHLTDAEIEAPERGIDLFKALQEIEWAEPGLEPSDF